MSLRVCSALYGQEHELGHELHRIPGGPVLAGLLVVVLVEPTEQVFEDGSHGVVVEPGQSDAAILVQ